MCGHFSLLCCPQPSCIYCCLCAIVVSEPNVPDASGARSTLETSRIRCSCLEDLERLQKLKEDGVLTEEEFTEEKAQIMVTLKNLR